jgi:hypothetical protein
MAVLDSILFGIVDFIFLLVPLVIIFFILYKIFSPVKNWLMEKYDLSWTKSCLVINFVLISAIFIFAFIYYYVLGSMLALPIDPQVQFTPIDDFVVIVIASVRALVVSIILSFSLYFFELLSSFVMDATTKKKRSPLVSQTIGITVSVALFLLLLLFVFSWAPLGIFVYVFYGGINPLPLII